MKPGEVVVFGRGRRTLESVGELTWSGGRIYIHEFCGECGAPIGKVSTKRGDSYTWLACDICGELILTKGLAPDRERLEDPEYRKKFRRCRLTPRCPGYHVVSWIEWETGGV